MARVFTVLTVFLVLSFRPGQYSAGAEESQDSPESIAFFEKKIRPLLVSRCFACHSADTKPSGGLRVDDLNGLLTGGNTAPAVIPKDTAGSLLLSRVTSSDPQKRMPLDGEALTPEQIQDLNRWINDGAAWPKTEVPEGFGTTFSWYENVRKTHWSWQPLNSPEVPPNSRSDWARDDIDRFILAALEKNNLSPVGDADRLSLIRRVTYDLTGLPPQQKEIEAFLRDPRDDAFEQVVDRLLSSTAFGEHWGRHWLDVARYGESTGPSRNIPYVHAWRYRDYVIDSLNADVPFDRFIREQIAGDLLTANSDSERDRLAIATGFLALGVKDVNQRFRVRFEMDNVDEQIDVVSRSVLGLTVSCARCHDHKFDPVPTADYYALAGIFASTENAAGVRNLMGGGGLDYYVPAGLIRLSTAIPDPPAEILAEAERKVSEAKVKWDAIRGTPEGLSKGPDGHPVQRKFRLEFEKLQTELNALSDPGARGGAVHGVREGKVIADAAIRLRGEAEILGPLVPRGFLTTFEAPGVSPVNPAQSGRLQLAEWLTANTNPLTPRVAVNRIWLHLMGQGIVTTIDNFGTTGDTPSHPELLDHLATRYIAGGWSTKSLIRAIVLTRTYQLSADSSAECIHRDPANRLIWRHTPRRLSAEEIRDSILRASGQLIEQRSEGSAAQKLQMVELSDNGREAKTITLTARQSRFRSVYLPLLRGLTPPTLEVFDPVEQTLVTGRRDVTTVPGQALFLMNSSFVRKNALLLAQEILSTPADNDTLRLSKVWQRTLNRMPDESEIQDALTFLTLYSSAENERHRSESPSTVSGAVSSASAPAAPTPVEPLPDPDQAEQPDFSITEEPVKANDPETAAWAALAQSLFGAAEFRYLQ